MAEPTASNAAPRRGRRWLNLVALSSLGILSSLILGVGIVALSAPAADSATWSLWGTVGESFGALNAIFSGLALAALVVTFWLQFKELRSQRTELALQRDSLIRSHLELHRAAEANIRHLHVDLMKMAINDPVLAELWPLAHTGLSPERLRQYFYANLVLQHIRLNQRIGTQEAMESEIRYVFSNPIMRLCWMDTAPAREAMLEPGSDESRFWRLANDVCNEYEAVLSKARRHDANATGPGPNVATGDDSLGAAA